MVCVGEREGKEESREGGRKMERSVDGTLSDTKAGGGGLPCCLEAPLDPFQSVALYA